MDSNDYRIRTWVGATLSFMDNGFVSYWIISKIILVIHKYFFLLWAREWNMYCSVSKKCVGRIVLSINLLAAVGWTVYIPDNCAMIVRKRTAILTYSESSWPNQYPQKMLLWRQMRRLCTIYSFWDKRWRSIQSQKS